MSACGSRRYAPPPAAPGATAPDVRSSNFAQSSVLQSKAACRLPKGRPGYACPARDRTMPIGLQGFS
jgi:hypothetical protein